MDWPITDLATFLSFLLPGFVAAWVFYGLTAHPKASSFERVVQALIFTAIVQAIVNSFGEAVVGQLQAWSIAVAVLVGVVFAWFSNRCWLHQILQALGITKRTSFPSEWFSAFNKDKRWVVLHLKGGRRLYGWPEEWPDQSESGHFVIDQPSWLLDDGQIATLHTVERLLIGATDVEMVEFLKEENEITATQAEIRTTDHLLVSLQSHGELNDGHESAAASAKVGANGQHGGIGERTGEPGQANGRRATAPSEKSVTSARRKKGRRR